MAPERTATAALAVVALLAVSGCLSIGPLTDAQEDILDEFEQEMGDVEAYSATVEVTTEFDGETTEMVVAVDARPATGEMRQEVLEPEYLAGNVFVRNETRTVSYDAARNDAFVSELTTGGGKLVAEITELVETHEVYYDGTDTVEGADVHQVTLVPGEESPLDTRTTVWVDEETMFPVKLATGLSDDGARSTTVVYSDVDLDPEFGDGTFTFDIPTNATVTTPEDVRRSS